MNEYLVISTSIDLMRTASGNIVFISSDGNYSSFVFTNGDSRVITMQLGQVERVLSEQLPHSGSDFIRIGKSLIINRNYISYINIQKQQIVLSDGSSSSHSLTASREALKQLKELVERDLKQH